jgi:hypothetical protein
MAATTVALSVFAVSNARFHAALTEEFESANAGSWNVERINGLICATVMDTRGIYMPAHTAEASKYADSLVKATDQISAMTATGSAASEQRRTGIQQPGRPPERLSRLAL